MKGKEFVTEEYSGIKIICFEYLQPVMFILFFFFHTFLDLKWSSVLSLCPMGISCGLLSKRLDQYILSYECESDMDKHTN